MKKYFLIITIAALFFSCSKSESQMDKTIFIPDEIDPKLPAYTEWGYNAFGAKLDRQYFLSTNDLLPCKVLYKEGLLRFSLIGRYTSTENTRMTLTFCFPLEHISQFSDLVILNDKNYELSLSNIIVIVNKIGYTSQTQHETTDTLNIVEGILHFRRAQMLNIDDEQNRAILSGTFDFKYLDNNDFPAHFSDGRFDMGINNDNFYAY
ncbi:MAG: hypothetical protein FWD66_06090 [Paludibacter sp.]|nr:hypothetical protein [Paludibacter sp.]